MQIKCVVCISSYDVLLDRCPNCQTTTNFNIGYGKQVPIVPPEEDTAIKGQCGGDHYKKLGDYQPWIVLSKWLTTEELRGFMKGTVISYLAREKDKGGDVDLEKSLHTMQLFQELRIDK